MAMALLAATAALGYMAGSSPSLATPPARTLPSVAAAMPPTDVFDAVNGVEGVRGGRAALIQMRAERDLDELKSHREGLDAQQAAAEADLKLGQLFTTLGGGLAAAAVIGNLGHTLTTVQVAEASLISDYAPVTEAPRPSPATAAAPEISSAKPDEGPPEAPVAIRMPGDPPLPPMEAASIMHRGASLSTIAVLLTVKRQPPGRQH